MESANCFNIFDKVYQLPIYTNLEFIHIEKLELE